MPQQFSPQEREVCKSLIGKLGYAIDLERFFDPAHFRTRFSELFILFIDLQKNLASVEACEDEPIEMDGKNRIPESAIYAVLKRARKIEFSPHKYIHLQVLSEAHPEFFNYVYHIINTYGFNNEAINPALLSNYFFGTNSADNFCLLLAYCQKNTGVEQNDKIYGYYSLKDLVKYGKKHFPVKRNSSIPEGAKYFPQSLFKAIIEYNIVNDINEIPDIQAIFSFIFATRDPEYVQSWMLILLSLLIEYPDNEMVKDIVANALVRRPESLLKTTIFYGFDNYKDEKHRELMSIYIDTYQQLLSTSSKNYFFNDIVKQFSTSVCYLGSPFSQGMENKTLISHYLPVQKKEPEIIDRLLAFFIFILQNEELAWGSKSLLFFKKHDYFRYLHKSNPSLADWILEMTNTDVREAFLAWVSSEISQGNTDKNLLTINKKFNVSEEVSDKETSSQFNFSGLFSRKTQDKDSEMTTLNKSVIKGYNSFGKTSVS